MDDRYREIYSLSWNTPLGDLPDLRKLVRAIEFYMLREYGRQKMRASVTIWVLPDFTKPTKGRKHDLYKLGDS